MQQASPAPPDLVILVPGIRTRARWQNALRTALRASGFAVELTNFGYFDLLRFLLPVPWFRRMAIQKVWNQLRAAARLHPSARVSIIAHSFGTHIVSEILLREFDFRAHRVIFCGSVVPYDFPFEQILERLSTPLLNEVGTRDYLPILAESATWGYGSAGAFGFRRPPVEDRWHDKVTHSAFLTPAFCLEYWVPFLRAGVIVPGAAEIEATPWWIAILSIVKVKYLFLLLVVVSLVWAGVIFARYRTPLTFEGNVREIGYIFAASFIEAIDRQLAEPCRQHWFCETLRSRRCMTVSSFDGRLRNLVLCKDSRFSWLDPVDGLRDLAKTTVPSCIDLTIEGRTLSVRLNDRAVEALPIPDREPLQLCHCSEATKRAIITNLIAPKADTREGEARPDQPEGTDTSAKPPREGKREGTAPSGPLGSRAVDRGATSKPDPPTVRKPTITVTEQHLVGLPDNPTVVEIRYLRVVIFGLNKRKEVSAELAIEAGHPQAMTAKGRINHDGVEGHLFEYRGRGSLHGDRGKQVRITATEPGRAPVDLFWTIPRKPSSSP